MSRSLLARLAGATLLPLLVGIPSAQAHTGLSTLQPPGDGGPVTVLYPSSSPPRTTPVGWTTWPLAVDGAPQPGNGHLVVISHGSGGNPWVHLDLAQRLVEAGYVVAFPQHQGDHSGDPAWPGPPSWKQRPGEVVRAIDAVAADPRWPGLTRQPVGLYGLSAGGHTALSLAGGRWSPAGFAAHCEAHLEEDFHSCAGLATTLDGGALDGLRKTLVRWVIQVRFAGDTDMRQDHDPRIGAIVADVPSAADFDPHSLARPVVPLGLVLALQDRWLVPQFHGLRILKACSSCEALATVPDAGHGMDLSPQPPWPDGLLTELLSDPPGFDRAGQVPPVLQQVVGFFDRHLRRSAVPSGR